MTKAHEEFKAELLRDPRVRKAYGAMAPKLEIARELIAARARAGLTQGQVASRMGTPQSVIARLEGGKPPIVRTLVRYAKATGARPVFKLVAPGK